MSDSLILTLSGPDRTGIVHAVTGALAERGGNITDAAQFNDQSTGQFFMRVQFSLQVQAAATVRNALGELAAGMGLKWQIHEARARMRTVLMVSRLGHCLNDLLFRWRSGQLEVEIPAIVSNHPDYADLAASYGIPFHHLPLPTGAGAEAKRAQERQVEALVEREQIDLVVLARYMQILSGEFCEFLRGRAINIHHSFLPSFKGAKPYYQAHERGVKLIGATAHYVTAELDEGPIIEQDVERVDHTLSPEDFTAVGRDVECVVLARAVRWHLEHRVLLNGRKTVVFR